MRAIRNGGRFYRAHAARYFCAILTLASAVLTAPSFAAADPVYTTLHAFAGGGDGTLVAGDGLIRRGTSLYGVAAKGGNDACPGGCGLVYTLTQTADPAVWQKRTLYRFFGGRKGYRPRGQLLFAADGAIYGVASRGGITDSACANSTDSTNGCGLVYRLTPPETPGEHWILTVLYRFKNYEDGIWPIGGLVMRGGALYGTTSVAGGFANGGNVFKLTPKADANALWTKETLAVFNASTGLTPQATLTLKDGKFYGTTLTGSDAAAGAVFELSPPSASRAKWTINVLHKFTQKTGNFPSFVKPVFDDAGRLYGTTSKGGADCTGGPPGCGVVFRLVPPTPPNTKWAYQIIHRFHPGSNGFGGSGGAVPVGGLAFDTTGAAFGVTSEGGEVGAGVIYKLTPPVDDVGPWTKTVLYTNTNSSDVPQSQLIVAGPVLYGILAGSLFGGPGEAFRLRQE
jgi:uncharacterized repeat protein (TIGR03803 family)